MQRESCGGIVRLNVKVTLTKSKENSLLANRGHLWCENGIHLRMPAGLLSKIVKDWKKENLFIHLKLQMKL